MKLCLILSDLFLFLLCISCSKKVYPSAEVNFLSGNEGTITVRVIGIGTNKENAIINAEQKIFDVLLFRGLPESTQKIPLIASDESGEKAKHKNYFDEFYMGRRYKTFVMSSIPVSDLIGIKMGQKMISLDVKINLMALKRDLEQFNIIRKFGY
ncbi:MAG: hypothetical protein MdMp024_0130 [Bacteroidales bacterium]